MLELEVRVLGRRLDDERRLRRRPRDRRSFAMRASVASRAAASIVPFLTCRSRFFSIVARPRRSASPDTSTIVTGTPDCAKTCAMPLPIWPAPITAIVLASRRASPARRTAARGGARPPRPACPRSRLRPPSGSPRAAGDPVGPAVDHAVVAGGHRLSAQRGVEDDGQCHSSTRSARRSPPTGCASGTTTAPRNMPAIVTIAIAVPATFGLNACNAPKTTLVITTAPAPA